MAPGQRRGAGRRLAPRASRRIRSRGTWPAPPRARCWRRWGRAAGLEPEDTADGRRCPRCGGRPQVAYFSDAGEALVTGPRHLICARCHHDWIFARMTCAGCGEQSSAEAADLRRDGAIPPSARRRVRHLRRLPLDRRSAEGARRRPDRRRAGGAAARPLRPRAGHSTRSCRTSWGCEGGLAKWPGRSGSSPIRRSASGARRARSPARSGTSSRATRRSSATATTTPGQLDEQNWRHVQFIERSSRERRGGLDDDERRVQALRARVAAWRSARPTRSSGRSSTPSTSSRTSATAAGTASRPARTTSSATARRRASPRSARSATGGSRRT